MNTNDALANDEIEDRLTDMFDLAVEVLEKLGRKGGTAWWMERYSTDGLALHAFEEALVDYGRPEDLGLVG